MGTIGARKLRKILQNVENVLAIEYLSACQALEFGKPADLSPMGERAYALLREAVPALGNDRIMYPDLRAAAQLLNTGALQEAVLGEAGPLLPK